MKLRRIEILGFKSFRTKTGLDIEDGVTGVVGPNGCGKSNILDAIRWSIGSQSPKDLRGRAMEDVIFAGSDTHRPMGFAEVSLTLSNDGQGVPGQWRDVAELRVTRRLFRTGESEYEINAARVRLRDIQELFLGTGVGAKEAYSIIEQGRIGFIVAARPDERRSLIEEAAGITRYKFQRRSAERRLEKTEQNLVRVRDIQAEVGRHLGSLKRQARRAARWRELTGRRRSLEVRAALDRRDRMHAVMADVDGALARHRTAWTAAQAALARVEASSATGRAELTRLEQALTEATEATYKARARADLLASNVTHHERELAGLKERLVRLRDQREDHDGAAKQAHADLGRTRSALTTASAELERAEKLAAEIGSALARARDDESALVERARSLDARLAAARGEHARAAGRLETSAEERRVLEDRAAELAERTEAARTLRDDAAGAGESARTTETEARGRLEAAEAAVEATRAAEKAALAQTHDARRVHALGVATAEEGAARSRALEAVLASGEAYAEGVREALTAAEDGRWGPIGRPLAERLRVTPGAEQRLASSLGRWLDAIVAPDHQVALRIAEWARDSGVSLTVIVAADPVEGPLGDWCRAVDPIPGTVSRRLSSWSSVPDALAETWSAPCVDDSRVARPDADVFLVGGDAASAASVVSVARDLDAARTAAAAASREVESARVRLSESEEALESALAARASATEAVESARTAWRTAAEEAAARAATVLRCGEELERWARDSSRARERANEVSASIETLRTTVAATEADAGTLEAERATIDQQAPGIRELVRARSDEAAEARMDQARIAERVRNLKAAVGTLEEALSRSGAQSERVVRETDEVTSRNETLEASIAADRSALVGAREEATTNDRTLAERRGTHDAAASTLREAEALLGAARKNETASAHEHRATELRAERARGDLEHAETTLIERFQLTVAAARESVGDAPFTEETKDELSDVLHALERLGAVNPAAEEEYAEAEERHGFLATQRADLEAASADLRAAIRKMDQTSRELFEATFAAIDATFREVFPKLFQGGRAHLELTNPDDLLETGIEIVAQPPGKRLQSMSLLSGGEKALTAVALVFSIFKLRPTPFCVLDEVDAPLDDANVHRFAEMVAEMSADSQFLIITHNKRTMEVARTLYGVTMEEPGVSKVVGVRLHGRESPPPDAEEGTA